MRIQPEWLRKIIALLLWGFSLATMFELGDLLGAGVLIPFPIGIIAFLAAFSIMILVLSDLAE